MRLLLDSHVVIWAMACPGRLGDTARQALESPRNEAYVSAATLWELRLKVAKGKLFLPEDFTTILLSQNFKPLPAFDRDTGTPRHPQRSL